MFRDKRANRKSTIGVETLDGRIAPSGLYPLPHSPHTPPAAPIGLISTSTPIVRASAFATPHYPLPHSPTAPAPAPFSLTTTPHGPIVR